MTIRPPIQCCDQFNDQCLFSENSLCFIGTFCSELGAQNWWWSSLSIHRSMVLSFGSVSLFIFVRPQSLPLCITKFSDPSHFTISGWVKSCCKTFVTIVGYYVLLCEYVLIIYIYIYVVTFGKFSSINTLLIPYWREQYKAKCKEHIIRIIFQRKGGLGNMRNIFVVRNINHSIDQWVVRGNKEMLFIVILLSHPDFRISDGLIARPIDSLKSSSHISYASCSAPSNIWSDASMIETDVFPFPIVCFHQLLIENI